MHGDRRVTLPSDGLFGLHPRLLCALLGDPEGMVVVLIITTSISRNRFFCCLRTELNEVGLKAQHIRAARGQGLIINAAAPLREGGPQK